MELIVREVPLLDLRQLRESDLVGGGGFQVPRLHRELQHATDKLVGLADARRLSPLPSKCTDPSTDKPKTHTWRSSNRM